MNKKDIVSSLDENSSVQNIFEIINYVNERSNEGIRIWDIFENNDEKLKLFINKSLQIPFESSIEPSQLAAYLRYLITLFKSFDNAVIPQCLLPTLSISLWYTMTESRRSLELYKEESYKAQWAVESMRIQLENNIEVLAHHQVDPSIYQSAKDFLAEFYQRQAIDLEATLNQLIDFHEAVQQYIQDHHLESSPSFYPTKTFFVPQLLSIFFSLLDSLSDHQTNPQIESCCLLFLRLLTDLLSQFSTRSYLIPYLSDLHFFARCHLSTLYTEAHSSSFRSLLQQCYHYYTFEVDPVTGEALDEQERTANAYRKVVVLQNMAFKYFADVLDPLLLASSESLTQRKNLTHYLSKLTEDQLKQLCQKLRYCPKTQEKEWIPCVYSRDLYIEILCVEYEMEPTASTTILQSPLYPTEEFLWKDHCIPMSHDEERLHLPQLNMEFLSFMDYLQRNYILYQLESGYEIKQDLVEAIKRVRPRKNISGTTSFTGLSRMATPLLSFEIIEVRPPAINELYPSQVLAQFTVSYKHFGGPALYEWETLHEHEVLYLIAVEAQQEDENILQNKKPTLIANTTTNTLWKEEDDSFAKEQGIRFVRGCEIVNIKDENGEVVTDSSSPVYEIKNRYGKKRTFTVKLDPAQYQQDMDAKKNPYSSFNLLLRRKSSENNFKSVLETIRELFKTKDLSSCFPSWLQDLLLGNGDPTAAHYTNIPNQTTMYNYGDTFLDAQHVIESFPQYHVQFVNKQNEGITDPSMIVPPFKLSFPKTEDESTLWVTPYTLSTTSLLTTAPTPSNTLRFTPKQIEAIQSGLYKGLTMIEGPPGTGKTDVVVQLIKLLTHNYPNQRILILTHSNHALNDLFKKVSASTIDQRIILRLGGGENELKTKEDYSKQGRINYMLTRRMELLKEVELLATSLELNPDFAFSCETAMNFYTYHIQSRMDQYKEEYERRQQQSSMEDDFVAQHFPFTSYCAQKKETLFVNNLHQDHQIAQQLFKSIHDLFMELKDYRILELLRSNKQRYDYLMTNQAKVIAMTCTHACIIRKRLLELNFKYDTLIMEETGQILDIESFIPMLLQKADPMEGCRLKRVILLGDHHQLNPIVKNQALQRDSHFDQSLFTRFLRLNVPFIQLDHQGRCRESLLDLYNWNYHHSIQNLEVVKKTNAYDNEYCYANPGFCYDYQMIHVGEKNGEGELQPVPWYYQNRNEIEYMISVYQYLRLVGYPAEKITILTPYNGQCQLCQQLFEEKFKEDPFYGVPVISTIDQYQGQQNDIVLLSLVRTKSVGHIRDWRRLVVALSRARLGLYVFGKSSLYQQVEELKPVFDLLMKRPTRLCIVENEQYGDRKRKADEEGEQKIEIQTVEELNTRIVDMIVKYRERVTKEEEEQNQSKENEDVEMK